MSVEINHCAIVILAAGQSSRLGSPKQLLDYQGTSLIQKVAQAALASEIGNVIVVLGANSQKILTKLNMPHLHIVENKYWEEGMSSSIKLGLEEARKIDPRTDGLMIMVCDQPFLDKTVLQNLLLTQRKSGLPAAASTYHGKTGTPAVFHEDLFPELQALTGDTGARKLISAHGSQVALVPFEKGIVDIDTKEDYQKLIENK